MAVATADEPKVLHSLPGRVRISLPGWFGEGRREIESRLSQLSGVDSAQASEVTRNVLVRFNPRSIG